MPEAHGTRPYTAEETAWLEQFRDIFVVSHKGRHTWRNGAEFEFVCDDDCPHPSHEEAIGD